MEEKKGNAEVIIVDIAPTLSAVRVPMDAKCIVIEKHVGLAYRFLTYGSEGKKITKPLFIGKWEYLGLVDKNGIGFDVSDYIDVSEYHNIMRSDIEQWFKKCNEKFIGLFTSRGITIGDDKYAIIMKK